jgi:hypothetical protein
MAETEYDVEAEKEADIETEMVTHVKVTLKRETMATTDASNTLCQSDSDHNQRHLLTHAYATAQHNDATTQL